MRKHLRDYIQLCNDAGLHPHHVEHRGKHVAVVCAEGSLICASTPSDWRGSHNLRARARRLARGL